MESAPVVDDEENDEVLGNEAATTTKLFSFALLELLLFLLLLLLLFVIVVVVAVFRQEQTKAGERSFLYWCSERSRELTIFVFDDECALDDSDVELVVDESKLLLF